ncbi:ribosome silencing factor [Marinihelvus fidelis]|uniref:Ribosomal silencing factor RsfS n=1 Tax=Marinihelvus fidelis TaxID=2613842 RepID=A0A5N0T5V4_9GAMM|nr:ribosome silencing factor [Marinihelvus fidelis]KAA9130242.1 ribosome silencing factor [Marinihelvus fidelis]
MTQSTSHDALSAADLQRLVIDTLEEFKAQDIKVIDVTGVSPLTDQFVIASGTSTRHVRSMADKLVERAKANGIQPTGVEGQGEAQWVLVDLNDVIVHLMLPQTRAFYNLEKLWEVSAEHRDGARSA